jgi:hypothetical protein
MLAVCGDTARFEYQEEHWLKQFQCGIDSIEGNVLHGRPVRVPKKFKT